MFLPHMFCLCVHFYVYRVHVGAREEYLQGSISGGVPQVPATLFCDTVSLQWPGACWMTY